MSDVSGIPNLGIPAMGGFNQGGFFADPSSGYQAAQAQYGRNNAYFGNQAATLAAAHMPQSQLYGGGSFGAQPAYYAALGAAYGRQTGGFAPGSVFSRGAAPFQSYGLPGGGGMGAFSPSPNYPGGSRNAIASQMAQPSFNDRWGNTPWAAGAGPALPDMISRGYTQTPQASNFAARFGAAPGGGQAPNYAAFGMLGNRPDISALYAGTGAGTGGSFASRFGAAPASDPNSFASRFAAGNYFQPGTPSQYYTGSQYPQAQQPPANYQSLFSADNPRGALPVGGLRR